ncbi:MAG: PQQ-binding-like beta-propeller repeat protein [Planctomycetaceae bacterium]
MKRRLIVLSGLLIGLLSLHVRAGDWPQWRGPKRDGHGTDTGLLKRWPKAGPKVAWSVETAGVGYSSLSVGNGRVFTQGDVDGVEHVLCFDEKTGKLLWSVQPEPVKKALDERVNAQFTRFDANKDGRLDQFEALAAFGWNFNRYDSREKRADAKKIAERRTAAIFEKFDANKDAHLDAAELPRGMQRELGRMDRRDNAADADKVAAVRTAAAIKTADKDNDGRISRKESRGTTLQRIFNRADQRVKKNGLVSRRGDGFLTAAELKTYYSTREAGRDGRLSKTELRDHLTRSYPGVDGVLTKKDLRRYYGGYRNGAGDGPRGTPTIDGSRVYALGGNGDLTCLDVTNGETVWHVNLQADLGGRRPGWGYSESPLVTGDLVIVTPGGRKGTLAALDKSSGKVRWRSAPVTQAAHYSSAMLTEIGGVPQIVQFARQNVFGVSLDGRKLLWSYKGANNGTANCATPIIDDDRVLVSSAYGTGSGLVHVTGGANRQDAKEVYFTKRLANHHGGLVKVGDYVYSFGSGLMCMEFKTGEIKWRARSVGKGSLVYADGMLYCLGERYEVALVEANPKKYVEKGRFRIERGRRPSWAHPVVANGRFYIRNGTKLTAYDVRAATR